MKRQILITLLMLMLLVVPVIAPPSPAVVSGFVEFNGAAADGVNVVVTNKATSDVITSNDFANLKTDRGSFSFDLGWFKQGYFVKARATPGDTVEVKVCEVSPSCFYSFEIVDTVPKSIRLSVVSSQLPPPVVVAPPPVQTFVCSDGSKVDDASKCPIEVLQPPVVVEKIVCADGTQAVTVEDCPLSTKANINQILTAYGVGGVGTISIIALIIYFWKKGKKAQAKKMLITFIANRKKKQKQ